MAPSGMQRRKPNSNEGNSQWRTKPATAGSLKTASRLHRRRASSTARKRKQPLLAQTSAVASVDGDAPVGVGVIRSYEPIVPVPGGVEPHTLILGTMPSLESLKQRQYYAHPQNAFWRIVGDALGFDRHACPYADRLRRLTDAGFLLWDVLHSCERQGSLDAAIVSETPNDIATLLQQHPTVSRVVLNGQSAAGFFKRHVLADIAVRVGGVALQPVAQPAHTIFARPIAALLSQNPLAPVPGRVLQLYVAPSTSPAFTLSYTAKCEQWTTHVFQPLSTAKIA